MGVSMMNNSSCEGSLNDTQQRKVKAAFMMADIAKLSQLRTMMENVKLRQSRP